MVLLSTFQNEDIIHRDTEQVAQCAEVIHRGQAGAALPIVDCLLACQPQILLKGGYADAAFFAKVLDILTRLVHINDRVGILFDIVPPLWDDISFVTTSYAVA